MVSSLPPFYEMPFTEDNGYLTGEALFYNDQMFQTLNLIVQYFIDGLQIPQKTATEITALATDAATPLGTMWYDSVNDVLKYKYSTGAPYFKTITAI